MESMQPNQTVAQLIADHQSRTGMEDLELSQALGYSSAAVVRQLRSGSLQLPFSKVFALADLVGADPLDVFRSLMINMPELLSVIERLYPTNTLTRSEQTLIAHLREKAEGREVHPVVLDGKGVIALVMGQG